MRRLGILGGKRGQSFIKHAAANNFSVVGIADSDADVYQNLPHDIRKKSFEDLLKLDLDTVVLANYCDEHVPFAIRALSGGINVLSEVIACNTVEEGLRLVEAVKASDATYMMAENYCFMRCVHLMRLHYQFNYGEVRFAEGEYFHPCSLEEYNRLAPGEDHWRSRIPSTYYMTHSLGPLMYITGLEPVSVMGASVPYSDRDKHRHPRKADMGATLLVKMNNGAVFVVSRGAFRDHGYWYRVNCTDGSMETLRTEGERDKVRVIFDPQDNPDKEANGKREDIRYLPPNSEGHGGGDSEVMRVFKEMLDGGENPLDARTSVLMSLVGILGWESHETGSEMSLPVIEH